MRTGVDAAIEDEVAQDVADMRLAASVGRMVLQRCQLVLGMVEVEDDGTETKNLALVEPKDIKAIAEAARAGLEMIRRARNLDDPKREDDDASPLLALAKSIGEARAARPQTA